MGDIPLPPSVCPPYMTFCRSKRGDNPLCKTFVKKILEKIFIKFGYLCYMNIKNIIRQVLREDYIPTETEYLGWKVPKKLYDDLKNIGVKLWDESNDVIYVAEIHFDNKDVIFEILTSDGEIYDNTPYVPGTFKSYYTFKIENLPRSLKNFIIRRFERNWFDYFK